MKRYEISSRQYLMDVIKKEIEVTTGLLHRNVLRLRGYCRHEHENFLIYYMPNKSLNYFLFGGKYLYGSSL